MQGLQGSLATLFHGGRELLDYIYNVLSDCFPRILQQVVSNDTIGKKLRELFEKHSGFKTIDVLVQKYVKNLDASERNAMWVTKQYLMEKCNYTK